MDVTPRLLQAEGLFDVDRAASRVVEVAYDLPIEQREWNIGLVVGPSGSGKTTLARHIFGEPQRFTFPEDKCVLDGFPPGMSVREITTAMSSVGLSSPPAWLRPFRVLSNGEQFRATLARALCEPAEVLVVDEFTSVVDRTVAKVTSCAMASAVRRGGRRMVAMSCHYDVEDWLCPDWVWDTATATFTWRLLRRRPPIDLTVRRADRAEWSRFRSHHYLSSSLNPTAACYVAEAWGVPVAFCAVLHFPHAIKTAQGWREHRLVCLPDYQGVGIGNALSEAIASAYACRGKAYRSVTSHPGMIAHRKRSKLWEVARDVSMVAAPGKRALLATSVSVGRITCGFRYSGPSNPALASALGIA